MIIGVIGGRDSRVFHTPNENKEPTDALNEFTQYSNQDFINKSLDSVLSMYSLAPKDTRLISGGSKGAEILATKWAEERKISFYVIPPRLRHFEQESRTRMQEGEVNTSAATNAFRDRNSRIMGQSDVMVFFWDSTPIISEAVDISLSFKKTSLVFPML